MKDEPIVIERTFNVPAEKIWKALTDKEQMKQWYFDLEEFKPEAGFEFQFSGGPDEKKYLHLCKITDVIDEKELTYSWRYDGYEGISYVTFELLDEGNLPKDNRQKARLKLTHEGIETFPADNSDFAKENFIKGWTYIVNTSLKEFLEK